MKIKYKNGSKGRRYTQDVAFLQRMPAGIPGDISRKNAAVVEARQYDATNFPTTFGIPVFIDGTSKGIRNIQTTNQPTDIYGLLVRPYPTSNVNTTDGLGTSTVNPANIANVLKKGYLNVLLQNTTAAALFAQAYVRKAATSGNLLQGGVEAAAAATVTSPAIVGTGTGTIAATVGDATKIVEGTYVVTVDTTSNTSALTVVDPNGVTLTKGKIGVAYSQEGFNFTVTAAGTMTAGDTFSPVVTKQNIPIPNALFMGPADASGNVEIAYKM